MVDSFVEYVFLVLGVQNKSLVEMIGSVDSSNTVIWYRKTSL